MLIAIMVASGAALFGLHRITLWAERRRWIYCRTRRMPPGAGAPAVMEVASILQPTVEYVIEETSARRVLGDPSLSGEDSP